MALTAIHPGEHLAEELKELGIRAPALARKLGVPPNRITGILNGQRAITGDTALRLAHFFGTSPEFWLNLQSLYEIRQAREKSGREIKGLSTIRSMPGASLPRAKPGTKGRSGSVFSRESCVPLFLVPARLSTLDIRLRAIY